MKNNKVRNAMKTYGVKQWELADLLGLHEVTLCKKLRHELPEDEQKRMIDLIRQHAEGGGHNDEL